LRRLRPARSLRPGPVRGGEDAREDLPRGTAAHPRRSPARGRVTADGRLRSAAAAGSLAGVLAWGCAGSAPSRPRPPAEAERATPAPPASLAEAEPSLVALEDRRAF